MIRRIEEHKLEFFNNKDESLGFLNETEWLTLKLHIIRDSLTGFYFISYREDEDTCNLEPIQVFINSESGQLSDCPDNFYNQELKGNIRKQIELAKTKLKENRLKDIKDSYFKSLSPMFKNDSLFDILDKIKAEEFINYDKNMYDIIYEDLVDKNYKRIKDRFQLLINTFKHI